MEIWLPIEDYPNYEISSQGNVRNCRTGQKMQPWIPPNGYPTVKLRNVNGRRNHYVHRLVADTFYDGDHSGYEVNHIDGHKDNNFIGNLEWCTHSENTRHAIQNGLFTPHQLPPRPNDGTKVRIVETGETFNSLTECAEYIGGFKTAISACLLGKVKTHRGYHFEKI